MSNTILITGGSGKIGFQLVQHFLQKDFRVITTTTNETKFLAARQKELENLRDKLEIVELNFMDPGAAEKIISFLLTKNFKPQHIIHNARCLDFLKIEEDNTISVANFLNEFHMDVVFPYQLSLGLVKNIAELQNIVFISSMYGVVAPTPGLYDNFQKSSPINYGVAKAAQIHLVKELAVRLPANIRVNCVSFGGIKGRVSDKFVERYSSLNPQGRMLEEADVVGPVDYLVSAYSKNMTGQNLIVDGGWTVW